MKFNNVLATIGNTPIIKINRLFGKRQVWLKAERYNPGNSIKDRIAVRMVEDAEKRGILQPDTIIIEPTSGNTGVGLAMVAAVKGYRLIIIMPESMSLERRKLVQSFGAELVLVDKSLGMKGCIAKAKELQQELGNAWIPDQFNNRSNVEAHIDTTVAEIVQDFPNGVNVIITGVGSGGHIQAIAEVLKPKWPNLKVFAVEPSASAVLSGQPSAPHVIQGLMPGFIPAILQPKLLDGIITVDGEEAKEQARQAAKQEGLLVGISTGATLQAIKQKLPELAQDAVVLGFNYDSGERYFSVEGFLGS